jgi:amino-acid N-acetyltransferase
MSSQPPDNSASRPASDHDDDGIVIREARGADILGISQLIEPLIEQHVLLRRTTSELALLLENFFVADDHGRIVGCAALEVYSEKLAELRSLVVSPEYRGRGIGKRLVEAILDEARHEQILEVMAITASEDFFRSCGFDFTLPGQKKALFFKTRDE